MVLGDVVSVCRRHFKRKRMEEFFPRAGLGRGYRRLGQTEVPDAMAAPERIDQVLMEFENLGERQEFRRHFRPPNS